MKIALPIISAFLASILAGGLAVWMAWQQNAQGEAYDGTVIHFGFLLAIFGSWVFTVMGVLSPFIIGWLFLESRARRRGVE